MPEHSGHSSWSRLAFAALGGIALVLLLPGPYRPVAAPAVAALLVAVAFVSSITRLEGHASLDELGVWFVGAVFLYTSLPLLAFMAVGLQYTPLNDSRLFSMNPGPDTVARMGWLHAGFLAAFAAGYLVARGRAAGTAARSRIPTSLVLVTVASWLVVTLLLLLPRLFFDLEAVSYADEYRVIQQLPLPVRQLYKVLSGSRAVLSILMLVVLFRDYHRYRFLIAALLAWLLATSVLLGGSRTELMTTLAVALALFHRFVRPVRLRTAVLAGSFGLLLFLGLGVLRVLGAGDGPGPFTLVPGLGEFEALLANALDLDHRLARSEFEAGQLSLAFADLLAPVPSQLLPFPKQDAASWYLDSFYPDLAERGGGMAFGVVSQATVGWGVPDLLLRGLVTGLLFAALHRYYRRHGSSFWVTGFNCYLLAISYQAFRASNFYWVTLVVQVFLPTALALEVARRVLVGAAAAQPAYRPAESVHG